MERRWFYTLSITLLVSLALFQAQPHVVRMILSELKAADVTGFKPLEELAQEIKKEIGIPKASKASQCKVIALGSKPCGGPWSYEVYSTETTNESRLSRLVNQYNELQRQLSRQQRIYSDCEFVQKPQVILSEGICGIRGH
jgi:hypothetical protein